MRRPALYSLALLILLADQISKHWVQQTFLSGESRAVVPGFFALTFVQNTGGAFGLWQSGTAALALAALIAAAAIVGYTVRAPQPLPAGLAVALALPLGGAVGNLIDRVRLGYVVDFLDLHVGLHRWPVFNVADSAICVGVLFLAVRFWLAPGRPAESDPAVANERL